ncbi:MAG: TonB-dependent receptor [Bacteroidetes bacterium]|nr:TonB-dependent receptor [Bacteroidota bacterium]
MCLASIQGYSQNARSVTGMVVDAKSDSPIPFCAIALVNNDNKIEKSVVADETGKFQIFHRLENFRLVIKALGYVTDTSKTIQALAVGVTDAGKFSLMPTNVNLKEVEVSGDKNYAQVSLDRKVFNVGKDITATGGTLADVLKQIPGLAINEDNRMNMRGSDNMQILVDGRNSAMLSGENQNAMDQIPAAAIERIEIITNPSSQFEASGNAGIINIVMKKNMERGLNGSASLSAGTREKYTAAFNINYLVNGINFFTSYNYRNARNLTIGDLQRSALLPDTIFYLDQQNYFIQQNRAHTIRAGIDCNLNKTTAFNFSITANPSVQQKSEDFAYYNSDNNQILNNYQIRSNDIDENRFSYDATIGLKKTFKNKNQTLSADAIYSRNTNLNTTFASVDLYDADGTAQPLNSGNQLFQFGVNNYSINAQSDYSVQLTSNIKFDAGVKYIMRNLSNDLTQASDFIFNGQAPYTLTNDFNFIENVNAVYAMLMLTDKKLSVQAGLRDEHTQNRFKRSDETIPGRTFNNLFPSLFIRYKSTPKSEWGVSYSKRIQRPSGDQQNPFVDFSDPQNLRVGNPRLMPELTHSFELSQRNLLNRLNITTTLYVRITNNNIQRFRKIDEQGNSIMTFVNANQRRDGGFEFSISGELKKWWNINFSSNIFYTEINAGNIEKNLGQNGPGWVIRMSNNLKLPKEYVFQLNGSYTGPMRGAQGMLRSNWAIDAGARKEWKRGKYGVALNVSDIFDTRIFRVINEGQNFLFEFSRKRDTRIITGTLSIRFGKMDMKKMKQQERQNQDRNQQEMEF